MSFRINYFQVNKSNEYVYANNYRQIGKDPFKKCRAGRHEWPRQQHYTRTTHE